MKLTKKQREELSQKYGGKCAYCGCDLPKVWHADHFVACRRDIVAVTVSAGTYRLQSVGSGRPEANTIDNFMPSCAPCNISKATYSLEGWRLYLEKQIEYLNEYNKKYRMAKVYGLIKETGAKVVFYFEKLQAKDHV